MLCTPTKRRDGITQLYGVYDFAHPGSVFEVHLREGGRFFAPQFPENSVWRCAEQCCADGKTCCKLLIEWGKYGAYDLVLDTNALPPCCSGSLVGNPADWRKMSLKRKFTMQELKIMDSEWKFEHPGGSFEIQFHADGMNSFVCDRFPDNAVWRIQDVESGTPTVYIDWGKYAYGEYDLKMAPDSESMIGSTKGLPEQWRKAARLGAISEMPTRSTSKRGREDDCGGCHRS